MNSFQKTANKGRVFEIQMHRNHNSITDGFSLDNICCFAIIDFKVPLLSLKPGMGTSGLRDVILKQVKNIPIKGELLISSSDVVHL